MALPEVASKLDKAIGLTLESATEGAVTLRLDPGELAVVAEDDLTYLHGGALATCIDTAAWYAAESAAPSDDGPRAGTGWSRRCTWRRCGWRATSRTG